MVQPTFGSIGSRRLRQIRRIIGLDRATEGVVESEPCRRFLFHAWLANMIRELSRRQGSDPLKVAWLPSAALFPF